MANRSTALGESFHAVADGALTLRGYAEGVARWFGREANLVFLPWERWRETVTAGRRDHLGPHRAQPALLDGEGSPAAGLPAAVLRARDGA